ncbi:hypothetical protein QFZ53_003666 [Microbacterium natoriense]|uniref:Uncharacterized protein n=1 Tax=Microbacterium natoriense TaxID=284570 RepID=A0AAW8F115_9MICO|nr:hypothetical protein [Microbacterium natoriense]MDQ0649470.1 hypothetical protein [Microbacterium natoriense]
MALSAFFFTLFLNVVFWSVVAVLLLSAAFAVVWLITAVILGVLETRRMRLEPETEHDVDVEDLFNISPL